MDDTGTQDFLGIAIVGAALSWTFEAIKNKYGFESSTSKLLIVALSAIVGLAYTLARNTTWWPTAVGVLAASSTTYAFFIKKPEKPVDLFTGSGKMVNEATGTFYPDKKTAMVEGTKDSSVITEEMVEAYAKHHGISLEDGSQRDGVVGSLVDLEEGRGEWPEWMKEEQRGKLFAPLAKARKEALDA